MNTLVDGGDDDDTIDGGNWGADQDTNGKVEAGHLQLTWKDGDDDCDCGVKI